MDKMTLWKTYSDFRFQRHKNHGERDQFLIRDHHEAFISREDFELAQEVLKGVLYLASDLAACVT